MADDTMTLEKFEEFTANLSEKERAQVARALKIELPVQPLDVQLKEVHLGTHTPKAPGNSDAKEVSYVKVPSLKLDQNSGTRGFWVKASVARKIAERMLEVCDENNL